MARNTTRGDRSVTLSGANCRTGASHADCKDAEA